MIKSCRFSGVFKPLTASSAAPASSRHDPDLPGPVFTEELDAKALLLRGLIRTDNGAALPPVPADQAPAPATGASPVAQGSDGPSSTDVASVEPPASGMDGFVRLQRRMVLATVVVSALAVPLTALLIGRTPAFSVLVGALAGLLYLRLLARSVTRLGEQSRSLEKTQLLVPIVLVLAAARIPQLEILPAFLGFLLYKPAVILQAVLDRSSEP